LLDKDHDGEFPQGPAALTRGGLSHFWSPVMSFSIDFVATSKVKAAAAIKQAHAPEAVVNFLLGAVEALPTADDDRKRFIAVKAQGHLCEGASSYAVSTANIEVREIAPNV
jgi:hypothetical protein